MTMMKKNAPGLIIGEQSEIGVGNSDIEPIFILPFSLDQVFEKI